MPCAFRAFWNQGSFLGYFSGARVQAGFLEELVLIVFKNDIDGRAMPTAILSCSKNRICQRPRYYPALSAWL